MRVPCLCLALLCVAAQARFPDNRDRKNFVLCAFKSTELCIKRELVKDTINIKDHIFSDQYIICGVSDLKPIKFNTRLYKISSLKHINGQFRIVYCKHIYSGSSDSIIIRRHADDFVRQKRQSPRGRYRGQTQSQYLAMDQQKDEEGKAEAHAAPDSSRATVTGRSGIGQAQSQTSYDPLCDNCDEEPQYIVDNMPRRPQRGKGRGGPAAGNTDTSLPGGYVTNSRTKPKQRHPNYPGSRNIPAGGSSDIDIPTGNRPTGGPTDDRTVPYSENTQFERAPQQTNVGRNAYDPQRNVGSDPGRHGSSNEDKVRPDDLGYQNIYRETPSSNKFGQSGAPQTPGDGTIGGTNLIDSRPIPGIPGIEQNTNTGVNSNGRLPYNSGNALMPPLDRSHPSNVGSPSETTHSYGGPELGVPDHGYLPIGSLTTDPQGNIQLKQRIPGLIPGVLHTDSNGVVYVCCPMNQIGTYAGSPPIAAPHGQLMPQHQQGAGQYPPGYQQQPIIRDHVTPNQRAFNTPALYDPDAGVGHVQQTPTNLKPGVAGIIRPNGNNRNTPGVLSRPHNNKPGILGEYIPGHIPTGVERQFPSMYAPGNLNYLPAGQAIYYPGIIPTIIPTLPQGVLPGNIYSPGYNQGYNPRENSRPEYETGGWKPDNIKQVYEPRGVTDTGKSFPSTHRQVQQPQDEHNTDAQPHGQFETGQNIPNQYGNVEYPQAPNAPGHQLTNQFDIGNYPQNSGQHPQVFHYPGQQPQEQYETGQHPQAYYGSGQQPPGQYGTSLFPQGPYNPAQNIHGQYVPSQQPHGQYGVSQQPHGQHGLSQQPHSQYLPGQTTLRPDENIYIPGLGQGDPSRSDKSGHISPGGVPYNEEIYGPSPYGAIGSGRPFRPEPPVHSEQKGRNGLDVGATDTGYRQYEPNTPGAGQGPSIVHQYGHEGQNATGINNVQDRQVIDSKGIPNNILDPNSIIDDDDSEAQATISQASNGTLASASSKGGNNKGRAQTQVQGSYTGGGSFSAQAQITDDSKGAESQVNGGKQGASSSAQGKGRNNKSQAQVELGSETGSLQTQAQSEGVMHSSNSQVQGSVKGGMADAQARGPGSTSSQAQIGFTPYKEGDKSHEQLKSPFTGSGSASAQSSGRTGQSQSQLQGVFKYGIKYNGAAQSGSSLDKDTVFPNRLSYNKIDVFDKNNKNIDVDRLEDMNSISETPNINEENDPTESSETKNVDHPHSDHHDEEPHSPVNNRRSFNYNHRKENEYGTEKYEGAADDYDDEAGFGGEVDPEYPNYDEFSQSATHQSLENTRKKGLNVEQSSAGNTQHIVLGSLNNHDAEITQQNSEQHPDETRIYQPGERVPGTGGYTIPIGFTGSVKSVASKGKTYAIGTKDSPSQAQTVSLTPGTGKINYHHPKTNSRTINPKNLKSLDSNNRKIEDDNRYISVSKSITGALDGNNKVKQQYSHTYYTKSSSCGYFAFTCTIVSGSKGKRKICTPKSHTNPDGTRMNC